MFPSLAAQETDVQILLLGNKYVFVLGQKKFLLPKHKLEILLPNALLPRYKLEVFGLHENNFD